METAAQGTKVEATSVIVTDIRMPFWSMVVFIFKWTLAAIPALILFLLVMAVLAAAFGSLLVPLTGTLLPSRAPLDSVSSGFPPYGRQEARYSSPPRTIDTSNSAIQRAIVEGRSYEAIALIDEGVINVNLQNDSGDTALHLAVSHGEEGVVRALVRAKANLTVTNKKGETAMDIAKAKNRTSITRMLEATR